MDRQFVYNSAIPLDTDLLLTNKDAYIGLAKLSGAVLGTNNLVNNATCVPTSPASLNIIVGPCEIYSLQEVDPTAYGDVTADTTDLIVKQGINLASTTLTLTAPGTGGYSQNYLIEFGFEQVDGNSQVLQYYNASNPSVPYNGPNNSGDANNTVRYNQVNIIAKAGAAATTGTQITPSPDIGYVGGFVVTIANGQSTIVSGNITPYLTPNPNFINETLTQKISQPTADARYVQQSQEQTCQFVYATDTGTANTYVANLAPAISSYTSGLTCKVKIANTNTSGSTLNLNGLGAISIVHPTGSALNASDLTAGEIAEFTYNGTNFQLNTPTNVVTGNFVTIANLQNGEYLYSADTGSVNALVATLSPAITSYIAGTKFRVNVANTNTGSSTLNVNGVGVVTIKLSNGASLTGNELVAGMLADFNYDGTYFQLENPANLVSVVSLQSSKYLYATDIGSTNAINASISPWSVASLTAGVTLFVKIANTNTGASTLAINGGTAKNIKKIDLTALIGNEMQAGMIAELFYDGTQFQLLNACIGSNLGSGYAAFPGGIILQWGQTPQVSAGTETVVTLPVIYPNAVLAVYASFGTSGTGQTGHSSGARAFSTSQIGVQNTSSTSGNFTAYWLTIGY